MHAGLSWREAAAGLCVFPGLFGMVELGFCLYQPVVTTSVVLTGFAEEMNRYI